MSYPLESKKTETNNRHKHQKSTIDISLNQSKVDILSPKVLANNVSFPHHEAQDLEEHKAKFEVEISTIKDLLFKILDRLK